MTANEDERIEDLTEDEIGAIMSVIATDGYYAQAEIVQVTCPACGEEFLGTKRHAGGFVSGHMTYHEFVNSQDIVMSKMGGI